MGKVQAIHYKTILLNHLILGEDIKINKNNNKIINNILFDFKDFIIHNNINLS